MSATLPNPAGWPEELLPLFRRAITCECATLTRAGGPITTPLTPYVGDGTLDVSTGLTYPTKAERVRRNPKVGLLFSDPVGSGLANPPIALVTGYGAVRDADLQANTDRDVREALAKNPDSMKGMPKFLLTRLGWYFARIPGFRSRRRVSWWPEGRTDAPPREWVAADIVPPRSDPAPPGKAPAQWKEAPPDWRSLAAHAAADLGAPVLTTVNAAGFPIPIRVGRATVTNDGFRFALPSGLPTPSWATPA